MKNEHMYEDAWRPFQRFCLDCHGHAGPLRTWKAKPWTFFISQILPSNFAKIENVGFVSSNWRVQYEATSAELDQDTMPSLQHDEGFHCAFSPNEVKVSSSQPGVKIDDKKAGALKIQTTGQFNGTA